MEALPEEQKAEGKKLFDRLKERIFRDEMLKARRRPDGRKFDEIRKIDIEVGVLPRTHGSSLFTRGETQALVTATLGTKDDEQRIELLDSSETSKRFMLHYNFPPFSVGEVGFMRGAGRREIGHGALAERALAAVVPDDKAFPYTMRIVSDILESNGSSSMASVCGGSLALMDAGVPITAPVAGIAMGLVMEGKDYAVLTDIAGAEDHYGDMDFKVDRHQRRHHRAADGHQGPECHARDSDRSAGTGSQGSSVPARQDESRSSALRATRCRRMLRASSPCRFRPTRSAS